MSRPSRTQLAAQRWARVNDAIEARREDERRAARAKLIWNQARPIRERKRVALIRSMQMDALRRLLRPALRETEDA